MSRRALARKPAPKLRTRRRRAGAGRVVRLAGALCLVAAVLAALSLLPAAGGLVPRHLRAWERFLFGNHAWLAPGLLALASLVLLAVERPRLTRRLVGLIVLAVALLAGEHARTGVGWGEGLAGEGGGLLGAAQAWVWQRLAGPWGPWAGAAVTALVGLLLVTRASPVTLLEAGARTLVRGAFAFPYLLSRAGRRAIRLCSEAWVGAVAWAVAVAERVRERRSAKLGPVEEPPPPPFVAETAVEEPPPEPASAPEPREEGVREQKPRRRERKFHQEPLPLDLPEPAPATGPWKLPPISLLDPPPPARGRTRLDPQEVARSLEATLKSFGVEARCVGWEQGPVVTRFELQPAPGVKVQRITSLANDIALALAAPSVRIEAPIPGKSAVGIELPNEKAALVTLREILESPAFQRPDPLLVALGKDIAGYPVVANLVEMPHLLIAGATGSGKSVALNTLVCSVLMRATPEAVRFLMIDPKRVELSHYEDVPHLLVPVVKNPKDAAAKLRKVIQGMERRYEVFAHATVRNVQAFNGLPAEERRRAVAAVAGDKLGDNPDGSLPYVVVVVDELADLMMVAPAEFEDSIVRLAQMARATGIHLVLATQRPSVDVITGLIKANIPSRIAFATSSMVDSRTILDAPGAEKLLGRGDMLYLPIGASRPTRVQGAYVSDAEIGRIVDFWKDQGRPTYDPGLLQAQPVGEGEGDEDELLGQAARIVVQAGYGSVSLLQRKMKIGYVRAARLVDQLEARGIVGPPQGSNPREVLVTLEELDRVLGAPQTR
ncbi:MAG: DNA translocase FtsK [Armatimonadota bacterium]|nr:DNA translocase FtsK [Armatimonadota bacterium]